MHPTVRSQVFRDVVGGQQGVARAWPSRPPFKDGDSPIRRPFTHRSDNSDPFDGERNNSQAVGRRAHTATGQTNKRVVEYELNLSDLRVDLGSSSVKFKAGHWRPQGGDSYSLTLVNLQRQRMY